MSLRFFSRATILATRSIRRRCRAWAAEALENRTLLSTFTVSDLSSDPTDPNSLPHAVQQANHDPGSTILFQSGLSGTIPLPGTLELSADVTITGPGANVLSVQGGGSSSLSFFSVFTVDQGVTAALSGLTVTGGNSGSGGGINNAGMTTLTGCTVSGNTAGNGGGIYNTGALTVIDCTISGNGVYGSTGGIANAGTMTLTNCTISGNTGGFVGGGIDNGGTLTLTNCTKSKTRHGPGSIGGRRGLLIRGGTPWRGMDDGLNKQNQFATRALVP
jgi:hypothetical protein